MVWVGVLTPMPIFLSERALTLAQARETRSETRNAMDLARSQIPLAPGNFILRVVPTAVYSFIIARALGPVTDGGNTSIDPDTWWVFDPDTETWLSQATFDDEGYIDQDSVQGITQLTGGLEGPLPGGEGMQFEVGRGPTLQEPEEEPKPLPPRKSVYQHMRENCVEYPLPKKP